MYFVPWVGLQYMSVALPCHTLFLIGNTKNIRIHHECEGRIEKSIPRIAFWHQETFRVMTNGDPEGYIFYPTLTRIMNFFSCPQLVFFIYLLKKSFLEVPKQAKMQFHMMTLLHVLGRIA